MNRPRGRGRRSKNNNNRDNTNPNKHYDSNGPDVRIRGSAKQVLDKYQQYASDALRSGDRISAEGYLQHAEHYQRIVYEIDAAVAKQREARNAERDAKRREEREARSEKSGDDDDGAAAKDAEASDADPRELEAAEKEEKPKKRRTYKKKEKAEASDSVDEDDGVLKTVTRGRKKKSTKKSEVEAAAK